MNRAIAIGCLGSKTVFINVPRAEAIRRYLVDNPEYSDDIERIEGGLAPNWGDINIKEFEFEDEFWTYDIGA